MHSQKYKLHALDQIVSPELREVRKIRDIHKTHTEMESYERYATSSDTVHVSKSVAPEYVRVHASIQSHVMKPTQFYSPEKIGAGKINKKQILYSMSVLIFAFSNGTHTTIATSSTLPQTCHPPISSTWAAVEFRHYQASSEHPKIGCIYDNSSRYCQRFRRPSA